MNMNDDAQILQFLISKGLFSCLFSEEKKSALSELLNVFRQGYKEGFKDRSVGASISIDELNKL
jgi:hypothetical protein